VSVVALHTSRPACSRLLCAFAYPLDLRSPLAAAGLPAVAALVAPSPRHQRPAADFPTPPPPLSLC